MKRLGIGSLTLVLLIGAAWWLLASEIQAKPTGILALNPDIINDLTAAACAPGCDLTDTADLLAVAEADGDGDGQVEVEDFASLDVDGDQLVAVGGMLWILLFVDDDDPVTIDPRADLRFLEDDPAVNPNANQNGDLDCDNGTWGDIVDEDCDNDGMPGDGVVVGTLVNESAAPGEINQVEAEQEGIYVDIDIYVVSPPPVGGIAKLPLLEPDAALDKRGSSAPPQAALAAGFAAGALALAAGAWYARTRLLR